jgi:flagellar biosynthesis protein
MRAPPEAVTVPRAAALAYASSDVEAGAAPRVVAKGQWRLAEEIIRRAREADVPVHESRELVALLMQIDLDERIPPALYVAVAEVLAWVYKLEQRSAPRQPAATGPENIS